GAKAVRPSRASPDNSMGRRRRVVRLPRRNIQLFKSEETTCGRRRAAKTLRISRPHSQPRLVARQKVSRRLARQTARRRDPDYKPALARAEQKPGYAEKNDDGYYLVYGLPLKKLAALERFAIACTA